MQTNTRWINAAAILIGLAAFFVTFGSFTLHIFYIDWLLHGGDTSPDFFAWEFYRTSHAADPRIIEHYGYPQQYPLGLTNTVTWFAMLIKPIAALSSKPIQYFGWWFLACFTLQAYFACQLLRALGVKNTVIILLGTLVITIAVPLQDRTLHLALCGQWMLLAQLWLYASSNTRSIGRNATFHLLIVILSVGTQPYFVPMTTALAGAHLLNACLRRQIRWHIAPFYLAALIIAVWIAATVFGYFTVPISSVSAGGLGEFSANLNTLFNPGPALGGRILPPLPLYNIRQYEGYNYLGAGVLLLLFLQLLAFSIRQFGRAAAPLLLPPSSRGGREGARRRAVRGFASLGASHAADAAPYHPSRFAPKTGFSWPIVVVAIGLAILSLSDKISFNDTLLWDAKWRGYLQLFGNTFRGTGRMMWPLHYLLLATAMLGWERYKLKIILPIVFIAVAIQTYEVWPLMTDNKITYNQIETNKYSSPLDATVWDSIYRATNLVVMYPIMSNQYNRDDDYRHFCWLAAQHQKNITTGYLPRRIDERCYPFDDTLKSHFQLGYLSSDSTAIFVTNKANSVHFKTITDNRLALCYRADDYYVLVPNALNGLQQYLAKQPTVKQLDIKTESLVQFMQRQQKHTIYITAKGEASEHLSQNSRDYFGAIGSQLKNISWAASYIGIFKNGQPVAEKLDAKQAVNISTGTTKLLSAGHYCGNTSSINIGGKECSSDGRGLNIVVVDNQGNIVEKAVFDTFDTDVRDVSEQ